MNKRGGLFVQALADLYRIFILHDNGGMWLDITSILLRDLSWVDNIQNDEVIDTKPSDEPEIIMYVYHLFFGGNNTVVFDNTRQR
jgi:hypothetical protein